MVGKKQKRTCRREFLSLEQHRRARCQQQQGSHGSITSGAAQAARPFPMGGISNLIVVLDENDELIGSQIERGMTPRGALPCIPLPLKEKAPFHCREQFLGRATIVAVVGLSVAG